uniref:Uncharacterized protein n=1 Tax=Arundo donax TaxID=35708 RepID=A0A0A8Y4J8_ARUDO
MFKLSMGLNLVLFKLGLQFDSTFLCSHKSIGLGMEGLSKTCVSSCALRIRYSAPWAFSPVRTSS